MNSEEFTDGFRQLDSLAEKEYHEPLIDVALGPEDDEKRLLRLGRLIGVVMKKPFATEKDLDAPSIHTRAYREWELKPPTEFERPDIQNSPEYQALETLRNDPEVVSTLGWQPKDVYELAATAHHERGYFGFLVVSCRKYLCKDKKLRADIEREVKAAKKAGVLVKTVTPETIVASGGAAIGTWLVQAVPVLGFMGVPVIAGIVIIMYTIGMDAFCGWASDRAVREMIPPDQR